MADDDKQDDRPSQKWANIATIASVVIMAGLFLYSQSQSIGANSVTLQNHTAEIAALQAAVNGEQVSLSAISAQLAAITQKLDDMQAADAQK